MNDKNKFFFFKKIQWNRSSTALPTRSHERLMRLDYVLKTVSKPKLVPLAVSRLTHRNEQVRHLLLVLLPRIAVLDAAPLYVTRCAVGNHGAEEDGVEPRERAPAASSCQLAVSLNGWKKGR